MLLGDKFFLVFVLLLFDQMMKFPDLGKLVADLCFCVGRGVTGSWGLIQLFQSSDLCA
jgi:hypothetical protein